MKVLPGEDVEREVIPCEEFVPRSSLAQIATQAKRKQMKNQQVIDRGNKTDLHDFIFMKCSPPHVRK